MVLDWVYMHSQDVRSNDIRRMLCKYSSSGHESESWEQSREVLDWAYMYSHNVRSNNISGADKNVRSNDIGWDNSGDVGCNGVDVRSNTNILRAVTKANHGSGVEKILYKSNNVGCVKLIGSDVVYEYITY